MIELQGFEQEIRRRSGKMPGDETFDRDRLDLPLKVRFSLGLPGSVTGEHLEENDPNGPYIALGAVLIIVEGFQRHVDR